MKTSAQPFWIALLPAIWFGFFACTSPGGESYPEAADPYSSSPAQQTDTDMQYENFGQDARNFAHNAAQTHGGGESITVYDKGLQMPMGTYTLPAGWRLVHDIAFDPNTARATRYQLDIHGPNGEFSRGMQHFCMYGEMHGNTFQQGMQQTVPAAMGNEVQQPQFGSLTRSAQFDRLPQFNKLKQRMAAQGMQTEGLELPFVGLRNGQQVQGKLLLVHCTAPWGGMLMATGQQVAPTQHYAQAIQAFDRISQGYRSNPTHEQRLEQIHQMVMRQQQQRDQQRMNDSWAAHQQRMAQNQDAFNAHQQRMQSLSQAQDASHQQFMNNLRSDGGYGSGGNGYGSHEAFVDQIHERSTFLDPYSGHEVHMDGQYQYNYTNGLGEFYGTDDPNFNHHSLPGNWQPITPRNW